jgi:hypothetical protein
MHHNGTSKFGLRLLDFALEITAFERRIIKEN